ncbi:hypothetical protein EDB81DRAFT_779078 [Dactylonectria macrodidyma]|uniref:Uncharacterized protein n=1 Tax=Dactylonectria macrodidyma TaxID=307937 RepID=A0A9P9FL31_9HYPO|nr:hypothetical protein EDB81DRAFT_779078 [Dactylonectria macrodidyma]
MIEDWGKVNAITALVTIPIFASSLLLQPLFQKARDAVVRAYHRGNRCEAIQWRDISPNPVRTQLQRQTTSTSTSSRVLEAGNGADDGKSPKIKALAQFLHDIWQVDPRPVPRPSYLDISKEYLRLDADVLLAIVLLDGGSGSLDRQPDPGTRCTLRFGSTAAQFRVFESDEHNFFIIGKLSNVPNFKSISQGYSSITKNDLRAIASGYPPFYRQLINTNSGVEIAHPTQSMRDIHHPSWLLAIGFCSFTITPLVLYDTRKSLAYSEACDRILETVERLQRQFSPAANATRKQLLDVAVKVLTRMNSYRTGSGAETVTRGTNLLSDYGTIGRSLNAPDILFAFKYFDKYKDEELSRYDSERLDSLLEEVLRAAVHGVFTWWQYVNNHGHEVPGWLLDDRVRLNPIWLEDDIGYNGDGMLE